MPAGADLIVLDMSCAIVIRHGTIGSHHELLRCEYIRSLIAALRAVSRSQGLHSLASDERRFSGARVEVDIRSRNQPDRLTAQAAYRGLVTFLLSESGARQSQREQPEG